MKSIIIRILTRLLGAPYYKPLERGEVSSILTMLAKEEGLERLPDFLEQCATQYRNQYMYSGNEMFKGAVLAFTTLREQILEKRKPQKKNLTPKDDEVIIKAPIY
jgi:hypothetical protein